MDNRTERIADGVWRVEVAPYINTFVLANDGRSDAAGLTVVDTGLRSSGPRLVRSIRRLGLDPRAISDVLLTHWHGDHAGGAARLARSSAQPQVHAGTKDLGVVTGEVAEPPTIAPPDGLTLLGRLFARFFGKPAAAVPSAVALTDGQRFEVAGGLTVVAAPGHTPGHCAFWLPQRGVLLAGDAVFNVWRLWRGPRFLCSAVPAIPGTIARLAALESGILAMAHGPPVDRDVRKRLESLVG